MSTSILSISQALGLSKATVSIILNGKGVERGFNIETIERVQAYAKEIGYKPNLLARSLSTGISQTVGLIIPAIGDTFYSQMIQGIEKALNNRGYSLIVSSSEGNIDKESELIKLLRSKMVDGLIIAPTNDSESAIEAMVHDSFPFVFIDRYIPSIRANYVIVNNEKATDSMSRCLFREGARRFAVLTTDTHLFVMGKRIDGCISAFKDLGLNEKDYTIVSINRKDYVSDIKKKLDILFQVEPDIDGIIFTTHYLAIEAVKYFIAKKIDYSSRFHMACIHSTTALDVLAPKMLFSMMPINEMGAEAVKILLDNIADKDRFKTVESIFDNVLV